MSGARRAVAVALLAGWLPTGAACSGDADAPAGTPAVSTVTSTSVTVRTEMEFRGSQLHLLTAGPEDGRPVLLLHGASFHSGTWDELGSLRVLAEHGLRVVALDLPGYGKSAPSAVPSEEFLAELLPELGLDRPVLVSPSMSGRFSFPLIARHPELVGGFVPVAPAGAAQFLASPPVASVPALVVWGTADHVFPVDAAQPLADALGGAELLLLEGARHPAYLDQPDVFHARLIEFVDSLPR